METTPETARRADQYYDAAEFAWQMNRMVGFAVRKAAVLVAQHAFNVTGCDAVWAARDREQNVRNAVRRARFDREAHHG